MPLLSRFYGIEIRMWTGDHPPPHMHVIYAEHRAVIRIDTLEMTRGKLPRRTRLLVLEWAMMHRADLARAWAEAERDERPNPIEPLP